MPAARASKDQRNRLLMALSEATKDDPQIQCRLDELAKAADLTPDQTRHAFFWIVQNIFAQCTVSPGSGEDFNKGHLTITIKGADEAERLRLPAWKRFLFNEAAQYGLAIAIIGGIIAGIIGGLIVKCIP
jgi:hypothetical protein